MIKLNVEMTFDVAKFVGDTPTNVDYINYKNMVHNKMNQLKKDLFTEFGDKVTFKYRITDEKD